MSALRAIYIANSHIVRDASPDATSTGRVMSIPLFSVLAVAAVGVLAVGFRMRRKAAQALAPVGEGYQTLA